MTTHDVCADIIGKKELPKHADILSAVSNNSAWFAEFASRFKLAYISSLQDFESLYSPTLGEIPATEVEIARKEAVLPCIDNGGIKTVAIANLAAFELNPFEFEKVVFIAPEILQFYLPLYGSQLDIEYSEQEARKYVENLLEIAYQRRASDIHIELDNGAYFIKFAVDGDMSEVVDTKTAIFMERAIAVLEHKAGVEVRSHKPYQDGQITFYLRGKKTEWRYHEDRTIAGKRVVIRQLHQFNEKTSLETLNYPESVASLIRKVSIKKTGMVLFTGPTGTGKSTGMTAMLFELHKKHNKNVTMIEDAPEVVINGISQIRVSGATDEGYKYGYPEAITASLRANPDVLMVGEIRNENTAKAAFQAVQTGHLAFSTLHVPGALDVLARLKGLGIDEYMSGTYLSGIFAQFLIPQLCPSCKEKTDSEDEPFVQGSNKNCPVCGGSGYKGRIPINEIAIPFQNGKPIRKIEDLAEYVSFKDCGIELIQSGRVDKQTVNDFLLSIRKEAI